MTVPSRFGVLRLIAVLFKTLAWIILVLSILGALGVGLLGAIVRQGLLGEEFLSLLLLLGDGGGIFVAILLVLSGLSIFLGFYAAGESIYLQLAIEENTRMTAALLLRMDEQSQPQRQPDPASYQTYYGEVVE